MNATKKPVPETDFAGQTLEVIDSLLAEIRSHPEARKTSLDSSFERDLGLDSLARFELLERVERHFSLVLPDTVLSEMETPRDLVRELVKASAHSDQPQSLSLSVLPRSETTSFPEQAWTINEILQWHVNAHPTRPHIQIYSDTGDGAVISYGELYQNARSLCAGLQALGLQANETVAIMLPTGVEYFYSFLGILLAGAIPVPIYPPARPSQLEDHMRRHATILMNCRAVTMITVPEARRIALLLKSRVHTLKNITTADELVSVHNDPAMPQVSPQDTAFIQYTSGSTGNPKGVVLSHSNLVNNIRAMGDRVRANADDVFVSWLPLYHDMGLIGAWLGSMYYGALLVVMPPLAFLARPQRWLQAIHRYGGTLSAAPNFGYELCLHRLQDSDLEGLDLQSWRIAFNGAEAVSPDTAIQFHQRFARYGMKQNIMMPVYGLAENSVGLAFPTVAQSLLIDRIQRQTFMSSGKAVPASDDDSNALRFVSCGQTLNGHEIRIADNNGIELPDRQQGSLQFRGPSATSGYLRNHEATEKLFVGDWLDTGDMAYLSEGNLYVTGRIKDIIIRAGRNLYPDELEEVVSNIPEIRKGRVAVFGVTDSKSGTERLVVLAETRTTDATVIAQLRNQINLAASDLIGGPPDEIVIARPGTVLKTSSGKVRRSACRELYQRGLTGKVHLPVWWQITRLMLTSVTPQLRRLYNTLGWQLWARYARYLFHAMASVAWLLVLLLPTQRGRRAVMRSTTKLLARLTGCPLRIEGEENLAGPDQNYIFVANHASYIDGPLMIAALNRPFSFIAKVELKKQFIAGTFLKRIETEFVERFDVKQGVEDARRITGLAGRSRSLFFFPEGTFTRTAGLLPFHHGAFLTAAETGLPVVPVAIRGTRSILRSDDKLPHRGTITIIIGKPVTAEQLNLKDNRNWSRAMALRDAARQYILRYCGEPDLEQK